MGLRCSARVSAVSPITQGLPSPGAGSFTYPGPGGKPLSSLRLGNVADGIEDLELFARLGLNVLNVSSSADLLTQLISNYTSRHEDPRLLEKVRRQAAHRIIAQRAASGPSEPSLAVGTDEHLLVDDAFAANVTGLVRTMHQPTKTGQMVLQPEKPWEFGVYWQGSVLQVNATDYRLYYIAWGPEFGTTQMSLCVALSSDGIDWVKPQLEFGVPFAPSPSENYTRTNILDVPHGTVFLDSNPKAPRSERFKLVPTDGGAIYSSADGFRWSLLSKNHIGWSDTQNIAFFDAALGKYRVYIRNHDQRTDSVCRGGLPPSRSVGMLLVDDLAGEWGPDVGPRGGEDDRTTIFAAGVGDLPCVDV